MIRNEDVESRGSICSEPFRFVSILERHEVEDDGERWNAIGGSRRCSPTLVDLKSILIKSDENKHKLFMTQLSKLCYIFGILVMCIPIIVCDIYFAMHDTTCLHNKINKLEINMYDYLLIGGIWGSIVITSYSYIKYYINRQNFDDDNMLLLFITLCSWVNKLFSTIWVILGSIMFWGCMNTSNCSSEIYNYLFASKIKGSFIIISLTGKE